jgi:3-methyladenine DNA glycosylase AlkD
MLHPEKAGLRQPPIESPQQIADRARRALARLAKPSSDFDARRYFRGANDLGFYNIKMPVVRQIGRALAREYRDRWSVDDACAFAETLLADRYLEVKGLGIEVLACFDRLVTPRLLPRLKRWLAVDYCSNWATTDGLCGMILGPLLVAHPALVAQTRRWTEHRNMWVRRASAVSIIALARRGLALDDVYAIAARLHSDREDLIQKAVGWLLREAGKADPVRLDLYLRRNGPRIPRTTVRYAIERFPPARRKQLLAATKSCAPQS